MHGDDGSGRPRVSGTFRETVTYNGQTCTSGDEFFWNALRDTTQATKQVPDPQAGSYSGATPRTAAGSRSTSPPTGRRCRTCGAATYLSCSPGGGGLSDRLGIASIPIAPDGSFSGGSAQDGVIGSSPAHFTYWVSGHVHGDDASGRPRVAGSFRESVTYSNGTTQTCTSSDVFFWDAVRDAQAAQQTPDVRAGLRRGHPPEQRGPVVLGCRLGLQNVSVAVAYLSARRAARA